MIKGVDTTFLIQVEIQEHQSHDAAVSYLQSEIVRENNQLALAPQVIAEFIHIATDPRRFERCLGMDQALAKAEFWWNAKEVKRIFPNVDSLALFHQWMEGHQLGRKRILDTMLAATYHAAGITSILSSNARDYAVFQCFDITEFSS